MNDLKKTKVEKSNLLFHKAFTAHQAGQFQQAEEFYRKALHETPTDVETLYLLGTACAQLGKLDESNKYLTRALEIAPDHPEANNNMGLALKMQRKLDEAEARFRRALEFRPDYVDALSNLGSVLELKGKLDEAESNLRQALKLSPDTANVHYNLGLVLSARDRYEEAAKHFIRGLELMPDFPLAYSDLGGIYKTWGRPDKALEYFERGLSVAPDAHFLHSNRGVALEELGRFEEALKEYEIATVLNPADNTAKWNMAYLFLRQGMLDRGWEMHEMRLREGGQVSVRFPFPAWDGSALDGKTILIYAEQGVGDEIFYASCIPDVIARARHCVIECDRRLEPFFSRSFPTATVVGGDRLQIGWITTVPKIDVQSAIGSLPRYLRTTLESFPKKSHYLVADPQRVEYWRTRMLALGTGLKVGICWRSGLTKGARHKFYSQLSEWGDIFRVEGLHFVNLQYDECSEELREAEQQFGIRIASFQELNMLTELDETAALIKSLDVVISAGTAVSEIAGALGVEVFRLDPYGKQMDALGTSGLPWHPATKLFAQLSPGDWETPVALVGEALRERALGIANAIEYVALHQDVEIAVSGSLDDLSTYVLKEQVGWFDAEYEFVLGIAQPNTRIVDVGAGIGAYAVPLAKRIAEGHLFAITSNATETNLLMKSRVRNKCEKNISIAIADRNLSLDTEMDKHGLVDIAFVRVASDLCNLELLMSGTRFFSINSPLLMFGARSGNSFNAEAANWLTACGYALYRLVPGLNLLVPFAPTEPMDAFAVNLFACKQDQAAILEQRGLLIQRTQVLDNWPGIDLNYWQGYLGALPYGAEMAAKWLHESRREKEWEIYWMALNLFAMAKAERRHGAERYACLLAAEEAMAELVKGHANIARLLTLCRILIELGKREAAVGLLNQVCNLLNAGMPRTPNEPCLALTEAFARTRPGDDAGNWAVAMILERRENLRAFSTYFTHQEALPVLEEIKALGFADEALERRMSLIKQRFAPGLNY